MKKYSAQDILALHPCWEPQAVHNVFQNPLSMKEILALEIPISDKVWFLSKVDISWTREYLEEQDDHWYDTPSYELILDDYGFYTKYLETHNVQ